MKILIIRHGDPDYVHDSLTEQGKIEAACLAERLSKMDIKAFYVSPLGRAKETASYTLKKMNRTATECLWLREFAAKIIRPDRGHESIIWDWLPTDWTVEKKYYNRYDWADTKVLQDGEVKQEYDWVVQSFDQLLASYGYIREGNYYRVEQGNQDTIVFFCHFGLECILLSHLLGISPMAMLHGFCAAPTSVTTLITEERRKGVALFRINGFGDISHLYAAGEEPSFSARFCEVYESLDRHD